MRAVLVIALIFLFWPFVAHGASEEWPSYRVGPGDVLEITVWQDERLNRQVIIPPDGVISYPLIGDLKAAGRTVAEIRKIIAERLSEYIRDPVVTVMLVKIESLRAYVIGKVKNPGVFPIGLDTDVMQILSMAGGVTPFASADKIIILRREKNGQIRKIPFNYEEVAKGKHLEQNIILQRGDVVVVP